MYLRGTNHLVENCFIHDQDDGYGIQAYTSQITVRNNVIANNRNSGMILIGGAKAYNNIVYNNGGGISFAGGGGMVTNNTLYNNRDLGIAVGEYASNPTISNNIIYGSSVGILAQRSATVQNNLFANNGSDFQEDSPSLLTKSGNLMGMNPQWVTPPSDFHLQASSPAIGAGVPVPPEVNVDKDGRPRTGAVDVGAYQYMPQGPVVPAPQNLRAVIQ
jgi:parallel beta-helix repeat protein